MSINLVGWLRRNLSFIISDLKVREMKLSAYSGCKDVRFVGIESQPEEIQLFLRAPGQMTKY